MRGLLEVELEPVLGGRRGRARRRRGHMHVEEAPGGQSLREGIGCESHAGQVCSDQAARALAGKQQQAIGRPVIPGELEPQGEAGAFDGDDRR
eukprot:660389-Prymnesium_polylepis.1